ncbi:GDSL-type esterase/lipase family protein [Pelosinus baikalensis]|uniref:GDSL-type esterase/lipase family protein n=1 Tax=Pelosinus baikalensis TaxID=2892015 RepID=A0ABS8HQY8_9FIRM|nr:GDSL-type esterase/lipase family protein [Pelosinus baikalensis]MCC5465342.1 GDSL-type esterase/lipase family protein [Pelosinus baikalensis]
MEHIESKIVAIGDSITYGFPYTSEGSWFNLASKQLNIEHMNKGINGDTTDGMLERFYKDVLRQKLSHVIIMGGTNDAYAGIAVDEVINNLQTMAELAVDNTITPIFGLPIPCNDVDAESLIGQYRERICQYAAENDIAIIDFYGAMVDESSGKIKEGLHSDGIHPNEAGYKVMAGVAVEFFTEMKMILIGR